MGIVVKESIRNTAISIVGVVISYVNILWLFPKFLSAAEIGVYKLIFDTAFLFVPLVQLGSSHGLIKFFPKYKISKEQFNQFTTLILSITFIGYTIFLITSYLLGHYYLEAFSEKYELLLRYSKQFVFLVLVLSFNGVIESFSRSLYKTSFPTFLREVVLRLFTLIATIAYAYYGLSFDSFINYLILAYAIPIVLLFAYVKRINGSVFQLKKIQLPKDEIKTILRYCIIIFIAFIGLLIINRIDGIMILSITHDLNLVGIFSIAFVISMIIEFPKRSIALISQPLLSHAFQRNDFEEIKTLYSKASINQLIAGLILFICISINLNSLFELMPNGEIYRVGMYAIVILGIARVIDMAASVNSEIIVMSNSYSSLIVFIIILASSKIIGNYYLIPNWGLDGAGYATLISLLLFNLSKLVYIKIKYNIQPFSFKTLIVLAIGVSIGYIGYILPDMVNPFVSILYKSVLVSLIYTLLIYISKASTDVNILINKMLKIKQ